MNLLRDSLRKTAYAVAPRSAIDAYLRLKMRREAHRLAALRAKSEDAREWIDDLMSSHFFRPLQKRSEILRLWEVVRAHSPAAVCEIGAAGGGTAFVFADAAAHDATIISVDVHFTDARRDAICHFRRRGQRLVCVEGDSHDARTLDAVSVCLQGRALDLLYLDGDHSYEGVATDFQMYAPLVRPGGLVVFHDIVPDYRTRYGLQTSSDTGGVPQFWDEIKQRHAVIEEIIEDQAQDGYGIGILHLDGRILEKA
ncbi:MAG: class I SAM-dependent methyltransferase [Acidobacteria bacterium]|nr:class I SAM-dependent methyltransferase [Acidobacteriota bacterium]